MAAAPPNSTHPKTLAAWRRWLEKNHTRAEGVWFVFYNQASGKGRFAYAEAVEEALCFGWIDSTANKLDAERAMYWFAPRKKGSGWSRVNKVRIERLLAEGRMHPAGLAKLEAAKHDGSWTLLDAVEDLEVPPDLQAALSAHPPADKHFAAFPPSARKAILGWIVHAKRPETRARRIAVTAAAAAENKRANEWRPKP
jgi:uncharacterized protein YdeI (YjbR/CyaY-like superfamily)